jgi:hypothetical protein
MLTDMPPEGKAAQGGARPRWPGQQTGGRKYILAYRGTGWVRANPYLQCPVSTQVGTCQCSQRWLAYPTAAHRKAQTEGLQGAAGAVKMGEGLGRAARSAVITAATCRGEATNDEHPRKGLSLTGMAYWAYHGTGEPLWPQWPRLD